MHNCMFVYLAWSAVQTQVSYSTLTAVPEHILCPHRLKTEAAAACLPMCCSCYTFDVDVLLVFTVRKTAMF